MPQNNMGFRLEFKTNKVAEKKGEVMIYSVISGSKWWGDETTAIDFDKALKALGDVDEITIRINSPGGEVSAAIAIRTALIKHKAKKTVDIEGSCCSAATLIANGPGFHVRIAKGSEYMIHRCSWAVRGHAQDMLSAYNSMINTDNDIADIYAERTGKTREEMLKLMDATTWYNAEQAIAAGFADEMIESAEEEEEPVAACAVTEEVYKTMQAIYDNVPELRVVKADQGAFRDSTSIAPSSATGSGATDAPETPSGNPDSEGANDVSNEKTAVAAGNSSENTGDTPNEGGIHMELKDATAEVIQQENPAAAQAIAEAAITAERKRRQDIMALKPKGAKWDKMAEEALNEGKSAAEFLQAVIAEQAKTGEEYLQNRQAETRPAENIGAGDAGDVDGKSGEDAENKLAKEIADLANGVNVDVNEMA